MKIWLTRLILALTLIAGPASGAGLTPFRMDLEGFFYQAWIPIKITGTQTLTHRGDNRWRMQLEARGPFIRLQERADFRWIDGRPVPDNYRYKLSSPFEDETRRVLFQRDSDRIRAIVNGRITDHPLHPDWFDPMSYLLLMLTDVRTTDGPWIYQVVDRHSADTYRFERVQDARAPDNAVVVEQVHPKAGTTYTLVTEQHGLPIHFLRWDGDKLEQQIRALGARVDGQEQNNLQYWPNPRRQTP